MGAQVFEGLVAGTQGRKVGLRIGELGREKGGAGEVGGVREVVFFGVGEVWGRVGR